MPCPPGHDPRVSIKPIAPASFKRMLGRSARGTATAEERGPLIPVTRAQNVELGHDLPRKFHIAQPRSGDQPPVSDDRRIDIRGALSVLGHLLPEVGQAVTRVTPTPKEARTRERRGRRADRRDRHSFSIKQVEEGRQLGLDCLLLPPIAPRQDEDRDVSRVYRGKCLGGEDRHAAHGRYRVGREADDLDAIVAVATELCHGVRGLPIGVAWHDEEVDGFARHKSFSRSGLTDRA